MHRCRPPVGPRGAQLTQGDANPTPVTTWQALRRETDGTFNDDDGGVGLGAFSIRVTAVDGQQHVDAFPSYSAGAQLLTGQGDLP